MFKHRSAFTLIELLIVVAIIAILAAIAVPNFLEAQTRAKISRVKSDMRALATALETYMVDNNEYPPDRNVHTIVFCTLITTPVSYIASTKMGDPFNPGWGDIRPNWPDYAKTSSFLYANFDFNGPPRPPLQTNDKFGDPSSNWGGHWGGSRDPRWPRKGCIISSFGPDRLHDALEWFPFLYVHPSASAHGKNHCMDMVYDATNGTKSNGDIGRVIGAMECPTILG